MEKKKFGETNTDWQKNKMHTDIDEPSSFATVECIDERTAPGGLERSICLPGQGLYFCYEFCDAGTRGHC